MATSSVIKQSVSALTAELARMREVILSEAVYSEDKATIPVKSRKSGNEARIVVTEKQNGGGPVARASVEEWEIKDVPCTPAQAMNVANKIATAAQETVAAAQAAQPQSEEKTKNDKEEFAGVLDPVFKAFKDSMGKHRIAVTLVSANEDSVQVSIREYGTDINSGKLATLKLLPDQNVVLVSDDLKIQNAPLCRFANGKMTSGLDFNTGLSIEQKILDFEDAAKPPVSAGTQKNKVEATLSTLKASFIDAAGNREMRLTEGQATLQQKGGGSATYKFVETPQSGGGISVTFNVSGDNGKGETFQLNEHLWTIDVNGNYDSGASFGKESGALNKLSLNLGLKPKYQK